MYVLPTMLAVVAAFLFGAATPASKWLLGSLTPFQLAGLLYLGAAVGAAPVALRRGRIRLPGGVDPRNRRRLLGAVVLGGVGGPVFLLLGLRLAAAASVSLWLNLEVAATAVIGVLIFHDHLGRMDWAGATMAIAGAALGGPSAGGVRGSWPGASLSLPACAGASGITGRRSSTGSRRPRARSGRGSLRVR